MLASSNSRAILPGSFEIISFLAKFGASILQTASSHRQQTLCRQASKRFSLGDFPFIFGGVLLARRRQLIAAAKLLSCARANAFARHLRAYLLARKAFGVSRDCFESSAPLDSWMRTSVSQQEMRGTVDAFTQFALRSERMIQNRTLVVVDIGTGNGILISHLINRIANELSLRSVRLFLVDRSREMLATAKRNCGRMLSIPVHISVLHSPIEKLNQSSVDVLKRSNPTFAVAAGCLHHLARDAKHGVFSLIREFTPELYLEELEANHQTPNRDSAELIWSVQWFYGALLKSLDHSELEPLDKQKCSEEFLIAEAIAILTKPKASRGNHHAMMAEWLKAACSGGFQTADARVKTLNADGLRSMTFRLCAAD